MRILVIGAAGDIGRAICSELEGRHDLVKAGRRSGEMRVDMADLASVRAFYDKTGSFDAVISAAGEVQFRPLAEHTHESLLFGLQQKLLGQLNLVLEGMHRISDGGSFTLTSGILDRDPVPMGTGAALANGALGGFVKSAAIELPRQVRINVVSPGLLDVSAEAYGHMFPGHVPVSSHLVARAYAKAVEGAITGQVIAVD